MDRSSGGGPDFTFGPSVSTFRFSGTINYATRASETTVLAGVAGEVFDGSSLSSVRLGFFSSSQSSEFDDDPVLDGEPVSGERTVEIVASYGDVTGISVYTTSDSFSEFTCDINADGAACPDDRTLMLSLIAAEATLGDVEYTARADFDLNGVITYADLTAFDAAYAALPDCNDNGIPDGCDLLQQTSLDTNGSGIPDECEKGDMNCDGLWNSLDIRRFTLVLIDPNATPDAGCDLDPWRADFNGDEQVDIDDIGPFLQKLAEAGP